MFTPAQQSTRRAALRAWDASVAAMRERFHGSGVVYALALVRLDDTWREADLPLPWYPSLVARGVREQRW